MGVEIIATIRKPTEWRYIMKLEELKKAIEELSDDEKRQFISEIIPEICDQSLTKEGCLEIFGSFKGNSES